MHTQADASLAEADAASALGRGAYVTRAALQPRHARCVSRRQANSDTLRAVATARRWISGARHHAASRRRIPRRHVTAHRCKVFERCASSREFGLRHDDAARRHDMSPPRPPASEMNADIRATFLGAVPPLRRHVTRLLARFAAVRLGNTRHLVPRDSHFASRDLFY